MTSKSRIAWVAALSIVVLVGAVLLYVRLCEKPRSLRVTIDDIRPAEPGAAPRPSPTSAAPRAPSPPLAPAERAPGGGVTGATGEASAAGDGAVIGSQIAVAREWKLKAQQKQLELYRKQIDANVRDLDKLGRTIERLKREGAEPAVMAQIQRRLQQMTEADTRMRLHLQKLEKELAEQSEREKEPADKK